MNPRFSAAARRICAAGFDIDVRRVAQPGKVRVTLLRPRGDGYAEVHAVEQCGYTPQFTMAETRLRIELGLLSRGSSLRATLEGMAAKAEELAAKIAANASDVA
ncbi:MAG: hypothetical protein J0M00_03420 [Burkholderiales bacterium]|nr:hypothetical protein [Burkholderiales bacterium]